MYLRDIAVYADEAIVTRFPSGFVAWFHRETCCITDLYFSVLGKKVATPDTVKANLLFTEHEGSAPNVRQLFLALDEAMTRLAAEDPIKAHLVQLRFFAGLSLEEASDVLGVSAVTAKRYWRYAKAWLHREVAGEAGPQDDCTAG
jgi:DNA-directed RNA polymerase specialized sigma24 family protein